MPVTYCTFIPIFANLAPGFLLGVRSDVAGLDLIDVLSSGFRPYMQYRSHTVLLPDERKHRVLRVIVKGEGTITAGTILGTWDGNQTETYTATGAFNSDNTVADVLLLQNMLGTKTAREFDVTLTLAGSNIVTKEILVDLVETE